MNTTMTPLIQFLNYIPLCPINKKPLCSGFTKADFDHKKYNAICRKENREGVCHYGVLTGPVSGLIVVDYDLPKTPEAVKYDLAELKKIHGQDAYIIETPSGGFHAYHKFESKHLHWTNQTGIQGNIDIRTKGGYVKAEGCDKVCDDGMRRYYTCVNGEKNKSNEPILTCMPDEIYYKINEKMKKIITVSKSEHREYTLEYCDLDMKEVMEHMPEYSYTNYSDWYAVGAALYNFGGDDYYEVFDHFSSQSKTNYSADAVEEVWDNYINYPTNYSFRTILYHLRDKSASYAKKVEDKLRTKNQVDEINDLLSNGSMSHGTAVKCFYERYKDKYVFSHKNWYMLNDGGIYHRLTGDYETLLMKELREYVQSLLRDVLDATTDDDKRKKLWKANALLENNQFKRGCISEAEQYFLDAQLYESLDKKNNLIGFNNGVYELDTHTFRKATVDDKISMTTGYDYHDVAAAKQEELEKRIRGYFISEDGADYFCKLLGSFVHGKKYMEKAYFFVGQGGNGKGVLETILKKAFGSADYGNLHGHYHPLDSEFLTDHKKFGGPSPETLKLKNRRIVMVTETENELYFNAKTFKHITGGGVIQARDLYAKKDDIEVFLANFKLITQTNNLPKFKDIAGIFRRIIVIQFPFNYVDAPDPSVTFAFDGKVYQRQRKALDIKDDLEKMDGMTAMACLLKWFKEFKDSSSDLSELPLEFKIPTEKYREDLDTLQSFMNSNLERTNNPDDKVSTEDLLLKYNASLEYALGASQFKTQIQQKDGCTVQQLRGVTRLDGGPSKTACIKGWKWKQSVIDAVGSDGEME